ncbi:MAG: hypothetical protein M1827_003742 [Pycnora praestabilis]|nr:MAG: hypothetical protein M1827_003742 [Pycnora praestabilis]
MAYATFDPPSGKSGRPHAHLADMKNFTTSPENLIHALNSSSRVKFNAGMQHVLTLLHNVITRPLLFLLPGVIVQSIFRADAKSAMLPRAVRSGTICDPFYGNPIRVDCQQAINAFGFAEDGHNELIEFLGVNAEPANIDIVGSQRNIQTPFIRSHGAFWNLSVFKSASVRTKKKRETVYILARESGERDELRKDLQGDVILQSTF